MIGLYADSRAIPVYFGQNPADFKNANWNKEELDALRNRGLSIEMRTTGAAAKALLAQRLGIRADRLSLFCSDVPRDFNPVCEVEPFLIKRLFFQGFKHQELRDEVRLGDAVHPERGFWPPADTVPIVFFEIKRGQ